jgi:hypothetical protein
VRERLEPGGPSRPHSGGVDVFQIVADQVFGDLHGVERPFSIVGSLRMRLT